MSQHALVLHPEDPAAAPEAEAVIAVLRHCGLIAERPAGTDHLPGPDFAQHITFMGCSPAVMMDDEALYRVEVTGPSERPRLHAGANTRPPRCHDCGHRFDDWRERLGDTGDASAEWTCPGCGRALRPADLDWRRTAGAARTEVVVWGVFEREGIPGDPLLHALGETTGGTPWRYFYLRL